MTNLVELREQYRTEQDWMDRAIAALQLSDADAAFLKRYIAHEREAAQAMISGVGDWYEERERRAIRELSLALPARGEVI